MLLSIVLFTIIEFALYWKAYYTVQAMSDDIQANLALYDAGSICTEDSSVFSTVITSKTEEYFYRNPSFVSSKEDSNIFVLNSTANINGTPRISVKADCSNIETYGIKINVDYTYKGVYVLANGHIIKSSTSVRTPKF